MTGVTQEILDEIALSKKEYETIVNRLGREPNRLELGMFGALWSEHCGYKHTKPLLKVLADTSESIYSDLRLGCRYKHIEPIEEVGSDANSSISNSSLYSGAVRINKDLAVVLKIESHNHPSAVEPYQGAATGIGGIVRDILATGARPIALLNSLRFGNISDGSGKQRRLLSGAVSGIADYGNCIGVPNVGGEIAFDECYDGNPLVNAMCVGVVHSEGIIDAKASSAGDVLIIAGAKTGRDGIHGASGLASRSFDEGEGERSTVQVGDPFFEKCLIEACLEVLEIPQVVGMQDCGAAGITSAAVEMAEKSSLGIEINVDAVPKRDTLTAYETMLSESQERMLLAVSPGAEEKIISTFRRWGLYAKQIGTFTSGGSVEVKENGAAVAFLPVELLTHPELQKFDPPMPASLAERQSHNPSEVARPERLPEELLIDMISLPDIASKRAIYRQYDHQVQNNTVAPSGGSAAVLRLKGYPEGIAISADGSAKFCQLDPRIGASIAVAEACRNLSAVGATPIALTDGLNFGNPEKQEVKYQIRQTILGIKDAMIALNVPVVSGNASLYNETTSKPIMPTPIIGAVGRLRDVRKHINICFKNKGDTIVLLGSKNPWDGPSGLPGSTYAFSILDSRVGKPHIDLFLEAKLQRFCRELIMDEAIVSAHDCADGGVAVAVCESAIAGGYGFVLEHALPEDWQTGMFGESQSRIVVTMKKERLSETLKAAADVDIPCVKIGTVGNSLEDGGRAVIPDAIDLCLSKLKEAWENEFSRQTDIW